MTSFNFLPCTASEAGFASGPLTELRTFFQTAIGNGNLPGAVLLLARGDQIILHEAMGYSDIAAARPLTTDAIFRLHSMTKPLTAVAMLLLYEEGKWDFDDPLSKHLPEFSDFIDLPGSRATRQPVLREIFTHSGGLSFIDPAELADPAKFDEMIDRINLDGAKSLSELVSNYASFAPLYEPGTKWEYSVGMDLQASIVERVSGERFDKFLEKRVFGPLGMKDTGFALSHAQNSRLVPGYEMGTEGPPLRPASRLFMIDTTYPMGGNSFRSTALDYARFARMILNRGRLGNARILKPESVDLMVTNLLSDEFLETVYPILHYKIGGGNGHGMNGMVCVDPAAAGRPVGKGTYEWSGAHGVFFWADPEHDILCVGMTHRCLPHPDLPPLPEVAQTLVYRALQR